MAGHDSKRVKLESNDRGIEQGETLIGGVDAELVARLPREALLDIVLQVLATSSAVKALVLDKLATEKLHDADAVVFDEEATEDEDEEDGDDGYEDEDATIGESEDGQGGDLLGAGGIPEHKLPVEMRGKGLSELAKLIMQVMVSAPAPDGGMPWREFEGIWPPALGTVERAVDELKEKGLLVAKDVAGEFVESTVPIQEQDE
ncbi:hypothetical protein PYCC9005_005054 [Savitreella phatthalungensis]